METATECYAKVCVCNRRNIINSYTGNTSIYYHNMELKKTSSRLLTPRNIQMPLNITSKHQFTLRTKNIDSVKDDRVYEVLSSPLFPRCIA